MESTHTIVPEGAEKTLERQARAFRWVRQLSALPGRLAGGRGEARAAERVEEWLRELGFEEVSARPCVAAADPGRSLALHCVFAALGCALGGLPGLALAGVALWSFRRGAERATAPLSHWLLPRSASRSVVARAGAVRPRRRVVLVASLCTERAGALFSERTRGWLRHRLGVDDRPSRLTRVWPLRLFGFAALVCAASALGAEGWLLGAARLLAGAALVIAGAAAVQWAGAKASPGANANASGVAALLTAAEQLAAQLPPDVELWCVAAGGSARGEPGLASLLEVHPEWCEDETSLLHFSAVGAGRLHYARSEGVLGRVVHAPMLQELARRVAASGAFGEVAPVELEGETGAQQLARRGAQVLSLVSLDESGVPRCLHQREDDPEHLDLEGVVRAADFGCSVISAHWRGDAEPLAYV